MMNKISVTLILLTLVNCGREASSPEPASPREAASSTAPARPASPQNAETPDVGQKRPSTSRPEITIDSPRPGEPVQENPVRVSGTARTFENNVVVRLRDARGRLLAERFTTAAGEMGQHNPYSIDLFMTRDPGSQITIEALEYSAKDGAERSLTRVTTPLAVPLTDIALHMHDSRRAPDDCTKTFSRVHRVPKSRSAARLAAEALVAGNPDLFPKGTEIRSVNLRDGVLTVDFNDRMANVGGSCRAQALRAGVERTLGALEGVRAVVITAGGSREMALQP